MFSLWSIRTIRIVVFELLKTLKLQIGFELMNKYQYKLAFKVIKIKCFMKNPMFSNVGEFYKILI